MTPRFVRILLLAGAILLTPSLGFGQDPQDQDPEANRRETAAIFADRTTRVLECISSQHIKHPNRNDLTAWAVRGLFQAVDQRVPAVLEQRLAKVATLSAGQLEELLTDARLTLGQRNEFGNNRDVDLAVTAVLRRLDPWSNPDGALQQDTFLRLRQVRMPLGRLPGPIEDLGLILRQDGPDGVVRVVTPLRDGPAYQAGLRADDLIPMFIEESDQYRGMPTRGRTVYTREHSLDDLEEMLKGRSDTSVKLYVQRPGTVGYRVVEVARGPTQRENVLGVCRDDRDRWHFTLDPLRRIGYVRVKEFGGDAQADLAKVLDELRAQGMRGLVLDLRFNAGGQLGESLRCAGLFVGRRPITVSYDDGRSQPYKGERDPLFADLTVACLVNGQTRRYAEIVAASLEDQRRAIIVGERTAGEVEIPGFCPISGVGELRVTTGVYLRAGGGNLSRMMTAGRPEDVWGVVPGAGLECRLSPAELAELSGHLFKCEILHHPWWRPRPDTFRDRQLELALTALRERLGRR